MKLSLLKRKRITLLFLLGVGLPSLALSYLAFRGIRNELALLQQRRVDEQRALAQFLSDTIHQQVTAIEQALSLASAGHDDPRSPELADELEALMDEHPLVEEIFYFDGSKTIRLLGADLLFQLDGRQQTGPDASWPAAAAQRVRLAQQREFQQGRYRAALTDYQRAFAAVSDPVLKGEALVAIARVQRKVGDLPSALAACELLLRDYGQVSTRAGVPLGPIALLEHSSLLLASGDSAKALDGYLDLYRLLVEGEWTLEQAQFDFFLGQVEEAIARLTVPAPGHESLQRRREAIAGLRAAGAERGEVTERLLHFQATAGQELGARISGGAAAGTASGSRYSLESGGRSYLVSLLERSGTGNGSWGLLIGPGQLQEHLLRQVLVERVDSLTTGWIVRGRDGTILLASAGEPLGSLALNATFTGNFPAWLIEFYQRPQNPYKRLLASSQSIYVYMFLLIASILIFGLVLTVRAVTQELELARLKSDFVSTVSHEFKSPLTSIRQLAEMLQGGRVPSEERRQRYYDVLVEQSSRLSTLVTNILDLARFEEGRKRFRFESVDVAELMRELVTTTEHRIGHEGFVVDVDVADRLPPVRADKEAITQAISNLIDNAVRYSDDAKQIKLRAFAGDGTVTISVQDFGVGIPADEIDRVFDRFYRGGDALTRSVKGSGLGLTLVKEVVEAHAGTVQVESEPGQGSTFSITLPCLREQGDAEDPGD